MNINKLRNMDRIEQVKVLMNLNNASMKQILKDENIKGRTKYKNKNMLQDKVLDILFAPEKPATDILEGQIDITDVVIQEEVKCEKSLFETQCEEIQINTKNMLIEMKDLDVTEVHMFNLAGDAFDTLGEKYWKKSDDEKIWLKEDLVFEFMENLKEVVIESKSVNMALLYEGMLLEFKGLMWDQDNFYNNGKITLAKIERLLKENDKSFKTTCAKEKVENHLNERLTYQINIMNKVLEENKGIEGVELAKLVVDQVVKMCQYNEYDEDFEDAYELRMKEFAKHLKDENIAIASDVEKIIEEALIGRDYESFRKSDVVIVDGEEVPF